jgi:hypothetical protein
VLHASRYRLLFLLTRGTKVCSEDSANDRRLLRERAKHTPHFRMLGPSGRACHRPVHKFPTGSRRHLPLSSYMHSSRSLRQRKDSSSFRAGSRNRHRTRTVRTSASWLSRKCSATSDRGRTPPHQRDTALFRKRYSPKSCRVHGYDRHSTQRLFPLRHVEEPPACPCVVVPYRVPRARLRPR